MKQDHIYQIFGSSTTRGSTKNSRKCNRAQNDILTKFTFHFRRRRIPRINCVSLVNFRFCPCPFETKIITSFWRMLLLSERLSLEGRLLPTAATAEAIKSNFCPCSTDSYNPLLKAALSLGQAELNETRKAHFVSG